MVAALALTLAGCGQQAASHSSSASSSSLLVAKTSQHVTASESPKQAVSLITAYAGNKYGADWAKTATQAQKQGLQVKLYSTDRYQLSDNGQGVAYNVTAGGKSTGLVYTIDNDDVTIYQNAKPGQQGEKLGTVSRQQMARYINKNGQGKLVTDLAGQAQVIDQRSSSDTGSSTGTSGQYGRKGTVTVPADMQGTWYSADDDNDDTVTIGANTITSGGETYHIYKQDQSFLEGDQSNDSSIQDATKDWVSGAFMDVHGLHFLNTRGWCQTAGDGTSYAVHTETIDGQQVKVLVVASGAEFWTDAVYYQNKTMAQQQADKKYDDLQYSDDN